MKMRVFGSWSWSCVLQSRCRLDVTVIKNTWMVRFRFGGDSPQRTRVRGRIVNGVTVANSKGGSYGHLTCTYIYKPVINDQKTHLDHRPLFNEVLYSIVKSFPAWLAG